MDLIKRNLLLAFIFCTGACVLILEVVAVRILSPFFGNTIFNFSSVLTTILAALSLGYYYGGKLADQDPKNATFFRIILSSGAVVLCLHLITKAALPILAYTLSIVTGPLVAAVIFFSLPSFLLGLLSPYVIALQKNANPDKGIGSIAGEVFFWGTAGSICGSLGTGFILIPFFGTNLIMLGTGSFLVLLGLSGLLTNSILRKQTLGTLLCSIVALAGSIALPASDSDALFARDGIYERVAVMEQQFEGKLARVLLQDRTTSGAIFVGSDEQPFDYAKFYQILQYLSPGAQKLLTIGGGAYIVPKELLRTLPNATIEVIEIEPMLHKLAQQYFELPASPRLSNIIADGRRYLHDSSTTYDYIFSDAFHSLFSVPAHLTTKEFFELAREHLNSNGILHANIIGSLSRERPSFVLSLMRTVLEVFPNSYFYAVDDRAALTPQNIQIISVNGDRQLDFEGIDNAFLTSLPSKLINIERFNLDRYPVLTDDYAPLDYFTAATASRISRSVKESQVFFPQREVMELYEQLQATPKRSDVEKLLRAELGDIGNCSNVSESALSCLFKSTPSNTILELTIDEENLRMGAAFAAGIAIALHRSQLSATFNIRIAAETSELQIKSIQPLPGPAASETKAEGSPLEAWVKHGQLNLELPKEGEVNPAASLNRFSELLQKILVRQAQPGQQSS